MPKAKTTSKKKVEDNGAGYRLSGFLIIVLFASLGLVWLWLQMPKAQRAACNPSTCPTAGTANAFNQSAKSRL
jgi:hypothetical protein